MTTDNPAVTGIASKDAISKDLCRFLSENTLASTVEVFPETSLNSIGVDSFSLMELILFIERAYSLVIPPELLTPENIATVDALSHCCYQQLQSKEN